MTTRLYPRFDETMLARRFGAKQDGSGHWYVEGDAPPELMNMIVPLQVSERVVESAPPCPVCRSITVKRTRRTDGTLFWSCSRFRGNQPDSCKGAVDYGEYPTSQGTGLPTVVEALLGGNGTVARADPVHSKAPLDPALRAEIDEIWRLAAQELRGPPAAKSWLDRPKVDLDNKRPVDVLSSFEGCLKVRKMLEKINS
jgi:hypothetical protein